MPSNLEDVSKYPYLFALLIQNGWTEDELVKLAYGNILRVFAAAEKVNSTWFKAYESLMSHFLIVRVTKAI